ncbi:MAG: histidine phosphatase family protein [Thermoplasmataceae archaeon]
MPGLSMIIDILRHSSTDGSGHLSPEGILLAEETGRRLGGYQVVFSSPLPRAVETAKAMSGMIPEVLFELGDVDLLDSLLGMHSIPSMESLSRVYRSSTELARLSETLEKTIAKIVGNHENEQKTLIVSHNGIIQLCVVSVMREKSLSGIPYHAGYCQGFRLHYSSGLFSSLERI